MQEYHIVIIEDTPTHTTWLRKGLKRLFPEIIIDAEVTSVPQAIAVIRKYRPHFIMLDVELDDDRLGFEVLEALSDLNFKVLFMSAYNEYMRKAFLNSATDFLEKPFTDEKLSETVANTIKKLNDKNELDVHMQLEQILKFVQVPVILNDKLRLVDKDGIHPIPLNEIMYVEAKGSQTLFWLESKTSFKMATTMGEFEELLGRYNFLRIHRSYIVNLENIEIYRKRGHDLIMRNYPDRELHITPEYRAEFEQRYDDYTIGLD